MTLNQRLTLLLLLGLTVTSAATSCIFSEDGAGRCVCNSMGILNPENLMCLQASELELRDGTLDVSEMAVSGLTLGFQMIQINKLIFNNVTISFSFISVVISFLPRNLNEIHIISSTLEVVQHLQPPLLQEASRIKTLYLEDTTVDPSLLQPSFQALHRWLFGPLKSLGLVRSGLVETDCIWAQRVENLTHLDLSENPISYTSLQNISHCASLSFKYLKSLHLRHSNLTSLQSLCTLLSLTPTLTQLDVSRNNFSILHYPQCFQVKPLTMLNLSHSGITEVNELTSASLEELDLSYNSLEVFHDPPQTLKKLFLSNNRLIRLPSLDNLSHLQVLKVDNNRLTVLITETDVSLSTLEQLDTLHAGRNPYQCDCALEETITFLDSADSVSVEDYPEDFLCATPLAQQGTQIMNYFPESCVKPTSGTQHHGSPLWFNLFVGLLSCLIYFC
ncbi:toll-like receptor 2 [Dicentrarchus labrax]|uniref:toll-like receptor 2 n=1 Tax=Dicentrarchus labrax TaxID=13489 RepID=UPI0021F64F95|nr:toll-like receptor 2 [Dicentrarchus labrax]